MDYPAAALPKNDSHQFLDPQRYNLFDGFSIGSNPLVLFPGGVSRHGLPHHGDLAASLEPESLVWLVNFDSGARVPLFAEVDANAAPDEAALIVRPQVPLRFDQRYVVALRVGLRDASEQPLSAPDGFLRLRDRLGTQSPALEAERPRAEEVLAMLARHGLPRKQVLLAWDFHTASREAVRGNLSHMVETALSELASAPPNYRISKVTQFDPAQDPLLARLIEGEVEVPSFLASDESDAWLSLDPRGQPQLRGGQWFPFYITVPRCALTAPPRPVLIFGPGLFADPRQQLLEDVHRQLSSKLCMIEASTHWIGLSRDDTNDILGQVVPDFSNLPRVTDRLQQAQVNFQALAELLSSAVFLAEAGLLRDGKPLANAERYFLGISNGAIQGLAYAALSRRIERFALHVGGGWWSMMMQRSSNFHLFDVALQGSYPAALDRLVLIHLSQSLWDYTDPISWADPELHRQAPERSSRRLLVQESRHDTQVPNLTTRAIARALALPALAPMVEPVFGLQSKAGPLATAYVQWDVKPPLQPADENRPSQSPPRDAAAHYVVRRLDSFIDQLEAFFRPNGTVVHTCGASPCGTD